MTGYDFDKTIYKGDSTTDFFCFMLLRRPYLLIFFLWYGIVIALYGMKILSKKRTKECLFFFIPWHHNIEKLVDKFWSKNANKIQNWYTSQKKDDDIVISASLSFIIKPAMDMLNIKNYIATNFNTKSGKIYGENCYGEAKAVEFKRLYPKTKLDAFYSDSMSDKPMFELAKEAFLVEGEKITKVEKQK